MSADRFTFSIVSHGHGTLLVALLRDLDAQPSLSGATVIVTLNIAEPFEAGDFASLKLVVVRNPVPKGFGANHNAAFANCTTPWFVVLNPDLRLSGGEPFSALAARAATIDRLAVIAPRIVSPAGATEDAVRHNLTPWSLVGRRILGQRAPVRHDQPSRRGNPFFWLAGMCLVFDAGVYRAIGGFDERIFLYGEDFEICARLYDLGYAIAVDSDVSVVHDARRDSHRSLRHLRWHLQSLFRIWRSPAFWRTTFRR